MLWWSLTNQTKYESIVYKQANHTTYVQYLHRSVPSKHYGLGRALLYKGITHKSDTLESPNSPLENQSQFYVLKKRINLTITNISTELS